MCAAQSQLAPILHTMERQNVGSTGELRNDVAAWIKLACCTDGSVEVRRLASKAAGCKLPTNRQVAFWKTQIDELRRSSRRGMPTKKRLVDGRKNHSAYKPLWEELYAWIKEQVARNQRLSRRKIRREAVALAQKHNYPPDNISERFAAFLRRYRVGITKATRVLVDSVDVQLSKCRTFHWFVAFCEAFFAGKGVDICLEARTNVDEVPQSPSGYMHGHAEVVTLGFSGDVQERNKNRPVKATIADMNHRIGSFIPFLCAEMHAWPKDAIMLFRGGARNILEEQQSYHAKVETHFSASGSVDEQFMLEVFLPFWKRLEGPVPRIRFLFMDHHNAHLTPPVIDAFTQCRTVLIKIPKSMTSILQILDVHVFHQFRKVYSDKLEDYLAKYPATPTNASTTRLITNVMSGRALQAVTASFDFHARMTSMGYLKPTTESVNLRALPQYKYDPTWTPASDVQQQARRHCEEVWQAYELALHSQQLAEPATEPEPMIARRPGRPKRDREASGNDRAQPKLTQFWSAKTQ